MAQKTVLQVLQSKNLLQISEIVAFLTGRKFKIVANSNSHNYGALGLELVASCCTSLTPIVTTPGNLTGSAVLVPGRNTISFRDIALVNYGDTLEEIEAEIVKIDEKLAKLAQEKSENLEKIAIIKQYTLETYDSTLHGILTALKGFKKDMTMVEKALIVKEAIKSN